MISILFYFLAVTVVSAETVEKRASDTSEYAPRLVDCPQPHPSIESASTLSSNETNWLYTRRNNTIWALQDFLNRSAIPGFDAIQYINEAAISPQELPNIGIAVSGGGYRALMTGAGALAAFDNRTANSTAPGQLGGLLQASTYLSGLSGGSWLVGSLYMHDFPPVEAFFDPSSNLSSLWQFDDSILQGPSGTFIVRYYDTIFDEVQSKEDAGFPVSITDYWGRALSFQLFNASTGSPGFTFSSISLSPPFSTGNTPMPLVVAVERAPGQTVIPTNSTIFEFNPWEFGSYDTALNSYAPLRYTGTNASSCVEGFDNIGFVVGTSSSLFNQFLLQINNTGAGDRVKAGISKVLSQFSEDSRDISIWPNPFFGSGNQTNPSTQSTNLTLVDGGEDLQNIPFHPLLHPERQVDVIFAIDASADTPTLWPNGTAMVATYQRSQVDSTAVTFPLVPDQNTFVNLGLNHRPTFFGCNATSANGSSSGPLVVYLPNSPYTYSANVSTFELSTNDTARDSIIRNGFNMATMGNSSVDPGWPACVACAVLFKSFNRTQTTPPDTCQQCFTKYCWDGTLNSTTPNTYEPTLQIETSGSLNLGASMSVFTLAVHLFFFHVIFHM